ncbi:hypothetical protein M427DRAFT_32145 [Gonapodya prolifera JEL478]|uniref:Uncharacterized protein n=1 Tax=Gonapodya prolifera (strain JEL478) TaxID=1344416 RepID=A0A139AGN2_GONPJ|nr:hypothetical protein M427DRAFT_32145 [Gonapodya prolifera JEL478]|eukprot:KXS15724.1 hypothetical protein M427DRAFT_32145 [Gonapodya prolifera JEL478]
MPEPSSLAKKKSPIPWWIYFVDLPEVVPFALPKALYRFKIQNKDAPPLDYRLKILGYSLAQYAVATAAYDYLMFRPAHKKFGGISVIDKIPTVSDAIIQVLISEAWFQFWLYVSHSLMRQPGIYNRAHKTDSTPGFRPLTHCLEQATSTSGGGLSLSKPTTGSQTGHGRE